MCVTRLAELEAFWLWRANNRKREEGSILPAALGHLAALHVLWTWREQKHGLVGPVQLTSEMVRPTMASPRSVDTSASFSGLS